MKKLVLTAVAAALATALVLGFMAMNKPSTALTRAQQAQDSTDAFFRRYVDQTGRVVRKDQGNDTVSEGQAYALLLAAATKNRARFNLVWNWTRTNLQRRDALFSWHWNGAVVDSQPATDADVDIARALVIAGARFSDPRLRRAGVIVGNGVLRYETAPLGTGRLLLPGPWASKQPPFLINPSYYSPAATQVLYRATRDSRWLALESGTRRVVQQLTRTGLPTDWASVSASGVAHASAGPSGEPATFGWEAVRIPLRLAESCHPTDRRMAAALAGRMDAVPQPLGASAVFFMARAASATVAGQDGPGAAYLRDALQARMTYPTYYSDAWEALGREMSFDPRLGGCPWKAQ